MLINRITGEQIVFYPYKATLLRNKNGHSNDMHHKRISVFMLSATSQARENVLHDSICVALQRTQTNE